MKRAGKVGCGLLLFSTLLVIITGSFFSGGLSPAVVILLAVIIFLSMLAGQLLVILQYRHLFRRVGSVLLAMALLILGLFIYTRPSLAGGQVFVETLYQLHIIWLAAYILAIGLILALYFYYHDRSIRFISLILLLYVWGNLIYFTRSGSAAFFSQLLTGQMPPLLTALTCLLFWVIPLGIISFLLYSAKIIGRELNPEQIAVQKFDQGPEE